MTMAQSPRSQAVPLSPPIAPSGWLGLARRGWLGVVLAGAVLELLYLVLWVIGYPISQAPDWSVAYLTERVDLWLAFQPFLEAAQERWPEEMAATQPLTVALVALFAVAYLAYGGALWFGRRVSPKPLIAITVAWALIHQVTLAIMPTLFTTDLFSYATYGRLAAIYGLNPFIHYPALVPDDRLASWIHPIWHYASSVYGPLWIDLSVAVARATRELSPADQTLVYRLIANAAHTANAVLIAVMLRPAGLRAMAAGLLLYVWNPLIVFEFAGNGHNDALMMTMLLGAVLAYRVAHPLAAIGLVTLAVLLKPAAVLALPLFTWLWLRQQPSWRARVRAALAVAALVLGLAVLLYLPWFEGPDTFGPVLLWSTISPMYINYVPDYLSQSMAEGLTGILLPYDQALVLARERVKLISRLVFMAYFAAELWWLRRLDDLPAACARVFLVFLVLVNTWVLAWYFTWPMVLVAITRHGWLLKLTTVGMTASAMMVIYYHHFLQTLMPDEWYALYLAPLAIGVAAAALLRSPQVSNAVRRMRGPVPETPGTPFR